MKDTTIFTLLTFIAVLLACNSPTKTAKKPTEENLEAPTKVVQQKLNITSPAPGRTPEIENKPLYVFQHLRIVDTIFMENIISSIKKKDKVNSNCFIAEKYNNAPGLFLFCKNARFWLVYDFNDLGSNTGLNAHATLNGRYITVPANVQRSGMGINKYGWIVLIDIIDKKYLYLDEFAYNSDDDGNNEGEKRCKTFISLTDGKFLIYSRATQINIIEKYCIEPGLYQVKNDTLARIKKYVSPSTPLRNLIGKTLKDLKKIYPFSQLKEAPKYEYGDESNELGYEVWNNNTLLFFITIPNLKPDGPITGITIVSPKFKIGQLNTKMTAEQVFKLYPNSIPHIDEITMNEYLYVKELKITLVFLTNETERVGVYEHKNGSDFFKSLNNGNVKVDLIMITK